MSSLANLKARNTYFRFIGQLFNPIIEDFERLQLHAPMIDPEFPEFGTTTACRASTLAIQCKTSMAQAGMARYPLFKS